MSNVPLAPFPPAPFPSTLALFALSSYWAHGWGLLGFRTNPPGLPTLFPCIITHEHTTGFFFLLLVVQSSNVPCIHFNSFWCPANKSKNVHAIRQLVRFIVLDHWFGLLGRLLPDHQNTHPIRPSELVCHAPSVLCKFEVAHNNDDFEQQTCWHCEGHDYLAPAWCADSYVMVGYVIGWASA